MPSTAWLLATRTLLNFARWACSYIQCPDRSRAHEFIQQWKGISWTSFIGFVALCVIFALDTVSADGLPPGDYRDSCKECVVKNSTMHCLCIEEKDKDPQPSQLPNADKCEDVKNAEGMLTCYKILKQREVPSASNRTIPQIVHYGSSWRAWTVMRRNMPFLPEFRVRHYNGLTPSFNITLTVIWLHQKSRWSRQPMISPQNSSKGEW